MNKKMDSSLKIKTKEFSVADVFLEKIIKTFSNRVEKTFEFENYSVQLTKNGDKFIQSKDGEFHFLFRKSDGFTMKWGKTSNDDPAYNPFGNEIADIEIVKSCEGIRNADGKRQPCEFCYKGMHKGEAYMKFETFKQIFDVLNQPKTMTQIAFGVDASCAVNPDIWRIFDYCNENGITPNLTVADIDENTARNIVMRAGACAVSYYPLRDENRCFDSIALLNNAKKELNKPNFSINIHALVANETYKHLFDLIDKVKTEKRLDGLNAIVFLSLKQKGRGVHFNPISQTDFTNLVNTCFEKGISFGMDSCGATKFLKAIKHRPDFDRLNSMVESCESTLYSMYIDCDGIFYPCSFMEREGDWVKGIDMLEVKDFVKQVWFADKVLEWRDSAIKTINCNGCNKCPYYNV